MKTVYSSIIVTTFLLFLLNGCKSRKPMDKIYQSEYYSLSKSQVKQGEFEATALSSTSLTSNYQSPVNQNISPAVSFKFSLNGKDNELVPGKNHLLYIIGHQGVFESPVIRFGEQYTASTVLEKDVFLKPGTRFTIRLDLREVLGQFKDQGFYTTYNGTKIYQSDFKGVFVAGNISPLIWDFDNLARHEELQLHDHDGDGIFTLTLEMNKLQENKTTASHWELSRDVSAFPQYQSEFPMMDALYNLGLEEMGNAIEPDNTFRTGQEWAGVWTRDISYSIILSMATLQPEVAKNSLLRKVKRDRVVQDTGTGGSWPVSSDRMVWAIAAWEVYKSTGDQDWLTQVYPIIKNSVEDDLKNIYNPETGLVKGESSFLDWRDQTYPKWMQPADIYTSENLGTNAIHYQTNKVLAQMAKLLNDQSSAEKYSKLAEQIKIGINTHLWIPEKGYYGQFLYGRQYPILSPRAEALGEALTVLFDIADEERQQSIVRHTPVTNFGIPNIYPQIPNVPPYHNDAVWPFVQAYWSLAAAKTGNAKALVQSLSAIYRPAALFLTNKENFVSTSGDFAGTQVNSSNMLWSLAGNLGMIYKVIFGINTLEDRLVFTPFVPQQLRGERSLKNYKYREAVLDITLRGYGKAIKSFELDGKVQASAEIPSYLRGKHELLITLDNTAIEDEKTGLAKDYYSPAAPVLKQKDRELTWDKVSGAVSYRIIRNGVVIATTEGLNYRAKEYGEYQLLAEDANGVGSFASEPLLLYPVEKMTTIDLALLYTKSDLPYQGYTGSGFIEISKTHNQAVEITVNVPAAGLYALDFRYANGNGPTNTENKCAIRSFSLDGAFAGTFVFPQRGAGEWSDWGFSNTLKLELSKGSHQLNLSLALWNENMDGEVNQAMLDQLRVIRIN
jgi:hypothetical protein